MGSRTEAAYVREREDTFEYAEPMIIRWKGVACCMEEIISPLIDLPACRAIHPMLPNSRDSAQTPIKVEVQ